MGSGAPRPPRSNAADLETLLPQGRSGAHGGWSLLVLDDGQLTRVPLGNAASLVVGRAPECDIRVQSASVSRRHLRLHLGPTIQAEDLGSANGTDVAGRRLTPGELRTVGLLEPIALGDTILSLIPLGQGERGTNTRSVPQAGSIGGDFVVEDAATRALHRAAEQAARFIVPVLIIGETGSGKEVHAEVVHRASPRASGPFIRINCAAIAPSLVEAELFGHEQGAFTGAGPARPGLLEAANGGTLFFDEVGELPLAMQPKLLRVLETREVTRVGGVKPRALDVRFVFATNQDLEQAVASGAFRRDLFFRINTVMLRTVPLRERPAEILPLARHFLRAAETEIGAPMDKRLSAGAERALADHGWPGNVRELRSAIYRAAIVAPAVEIEAADLGLQPSPSHGAPRSSEQEPGTNADPERERIDAALLQCGGNQRRAAALLGMSLRTLVRRLSAHAVPRPRGKPGHVATGRRTR